MLSLFRLMVFVLALPFFAATSTADLSPGAAPGVETLRANLSIAEIKHGFTPVRIGGLLSKRITALMEDGPEDEQPPFAHFVRSFDGDDQIDTSSGFAVVAFDISAHAPIPVRAPLTPAYPAFAGFPTGPPAV